MSNYFLQSDIDDIRFYMMPKSLFQNPNYPKEKLSITSKVMYSFLRDRVELSRVNNWIDEQGRIYLIFTRENIAELLELSVRTIISCFKELNECELIEEFHQGMNKPNLIYLKKTKTSIHSKPCGIRTCKICTSGHENIAPPDMQNLHSSNTNNNDTNKSETEKSSRDMSDGQSKQKTFFNLPQKEEVVSVKKKLTQIEQTTERIASAKQNGDWSSVTDTNFAHYYILKHNELFQTITFDRYSSVSIIRDSFIKRHSIPKEKVCDYIDSVLGSHKVSKDFPSLTFNMLNKNTKMMNDLIKTADIKLKTFEKKFKTYDEQDDSKHLKTSPNNDNDFF